MINIDKEIFPNVGDPRKFQVKCWESIIYNIYFVRSWSKYLYLHFYSYIDQRKDSWV